MINLKKPINAKLTINSDNKLVLSDDEELIIKQHWEKAISKNSNLFDGPLYFFSSIENNKINLVQSSYKYHLGIQHLNHSKNALAYRTLAITSSCLCSDNYFIIGKRSTKVSQDQDCWEFCPSGSFEPTNKHVNLFTDALKEQIYRELEEEMGILNHDIQSIQELFFVDDKENNTLDACSTTKLNLTSEQTLKKIKEVSCSEYSAFEAVKNELYALNKVKDQKNLGFISKHILEQLIQNLNA